jgi:hypothetical protein
MFRMMIKASMMTPVTTQRSADVRGALPVIKVRKPKIIDAINIPFIAIEIQDANIGDMSDPPCLPQG